MDYKFFGGGGVRIKKGGGIGVKKGGGDEERGD